MMSIITDIKAGIAISIWLGLPLIMLIFNALGPIYLSYTSLFLSYIIQALLMILPLDIPCPRIIQKFFNYSVSAFIDYFSCRVICQDRDALVNCQHPIVYGYEPHGVLPLGMCVFTQFNSLLPRQLKRPHALLTSTLFWTPLLRNLYYWAGCRPVSRSMISDLLGKKHASVILCPGGVAECGVMQPGQEVCFLRLRTGFVRLALTHNAALVPIIAINQSAQFNYWRPFIDRPKSRIGSILISRFARLAGFMPLIPWGRFLLPIPYKEPLTLVVGAPILPPTDINSSGEAIPPSSKQVEQYLNEFIQQVQELYDQHQAVTNVVLKKPLRIC